MDLLGRARKNVYVIGAGFSQSVGYPLTSELLPKVWRRLGSKTRDRLEKVINFHHPDFRRGKKTSFPNIEQLLTEIAVNEDMFDASRPAQGNFPRGELASVREELLYEIVKWF